MEKLLFILLNEDGFADYAGEWIGVSYLSAILKQYKVVEIDYISTLKTDTDVILEKCEQYKPDYIGIPVLCFNYNQVQKIVEKIKILYPKIHITLGHREATKMKGEILEDINADSCVIGEGEFTFKSLLMKLNAGETLHACKGICFRDPTNNTIVVNSENDRIVDLDSLPFPDRSIKNNYNKYHQYVNYVITTRGCKGTCTFCDNSALQKHNDIYCRSINNVLDEIEEIIKSSNNNYIAFADDSFEDEENNRLKDLYEGITYRNIKFRFSLNMRAETIDIEKAELLAKLVKIGLNKVYLGIDAGNEYDLKLYCKKATIMDNTKGIFFLNKYDIPYEYGFIMFNPYSTRENLKKNIEFLINNKMQVNTSIITNRFVIYPGVPLYHKILRDNLLKPNEYTRKEKYCYNFKENDIDRIWNTLYDFRNISIDRETFSMVYGFYKYLLTEEKQNLSNEFNEYILRYIKLNTQFSTNLFNYVVENYNMEGDAINNIFSKEIMILKDTWDKAYEFSRKNRISIERTRMKNAKGRGDKESLLLYYSYNYGATCHC